MGDGGKPAAAREDGGEGPVAHVAAGSGEVAVDLVTVFNHAANRAPQASAGCFQLRAACDPRGEGSELPIGSSIACASSFQHGSEVRITKVESVR